MRIYKANPAPDRSSFLDQDQQFLHQVLLRIGPGRAYGSPIHDGSLIDHTTAPMDLYFGRR